MTASTIAGRYSRDAEIGRGGMGAVWRGTDQVLGRPVALKRIGIAPGGVTPDALRAAREARLAARLNDPHVVSVFDLVDAADGDESSAGEQWLVMEYVEGTDLAELIRRRGAMGADEIAPILAQTAAALAAAHASGIVHRDVKPSNILVTSGGHVKLSDFGIARTQADAALTQTGLVTGSPAYLSPEVASGRLATPPSDVWSLGATLFHALEGHPPYELGDNVVGGLYRIVHEPPPRPADAGWLTPLLLGTMTHEPGERWTAAQVQTFLATREVPQTVAPAPEPTAAEPGTATSLLGAPDGPAILTPRTHRRDGTGVVSSQPGRAWWVVAAAALVVIALVGWAVAVGFGDDGSDDQATGTTPQPSAPSSTAPTPSSSASPSVTGSAAAPTAASMTAFLSGYLDAVVSDPASAFAELTPGYQQQSGGLPGYRRFWSPVTSAELIRASADPASLTISYRYRYVRGGGGSTVENHRMQLEYDDGQYLIAGQS